MYGGFCVVIINTYVLLKKKKNIQSTNMSTLFLHIIVFLPMTMILRISNNIS